MYKKYKELGFDIITKPSNSGLYKNYYLGKRGSDGNVNAYLLACSINIDDNYNGHKQEVIKTCLDEFVEENLYNPIWD